MVLTTRGLFPETPELCEPVAWCVPGGDKLLHAPLLAFTQTCPRPTWLTAASLPTAPVGIGLGCGLGAAEREPSQPGTCLDGYYQSQELGEDWALLEAGLRPMGEYTTDLMPPAQVGLAQGRGLFCGRLLCERGRCPAAPNSCSGPGNNSPRPGPGLRSSHVLSALPSQPSCEVGTVGIPAVQIWRPSVTRPSSGVRC